ncbi:MAG: Gfo/Idh/MocA family oxidoreductase [Chloroflexi bacterium]|nr:Gfo/Idh/MocA family oxidoreductase [Chloroflexota bacterium]
MTGFPSVDPLGVAVVGCGAISRAHLPAIQATPTLRLAGVYDADPRRREDAARQHGIRSYESWEAVLADPAVQVVALLLPHDLHCPLTLEAAAAGKHLMVEKPLANTVDECSRMIAAAAHHGVALMPCHTRLFEEGVRRLRRWLSDGAIGDVYLAQTLGLESPQTVSVRPWLGAGRSGGGVLMAQSIHVVYVLQALVGPVEEVACLRGGRKIVPMQREDTALAILRFTSGAVAEITATFGQTVGPYEHAILLYGSDGYAGYRLSSRGSSRARLLESLSERLYGDRELHTTELGPDDNFQRMWAAFADAIQAGRRPPVTGEDGRVAVAVVEAAYRSADERRAVRLEELLS